jgi:hypothetical protein
MTEALIVDASVAVKWGVEEEGSEIAEQILRSAVEINAPRLIFGEVANAIWKKVRRRDLLSETGAEAVRLLPGCIHTVLDGDAFLAEAYEIAVAHDHPVYDCVYLACAKDRDLSLVTADLRLIRRFSASPYARYILPLSDWRP